MQNTEKYLSNTSMFKVVSFQCFNLYNNVSMSSGYVSLAYVVEPALLFCVTTHLDCPLLLKKHKKYKRQTNHYTFHDIIMKPTR